MEQQLPVPVVRIAKQPVIPHPTSQGYQTGSTPMKPDGGVSVFSGISVYASSAGDKTYSPPSSALVEPTGFTADEGYVEISGSYTVEGAVVIASARATIADGVAVAIQMGLNAGPNRIAIGDESLVLPLAYNSQTTSIDGNVVIAESSAVYNVDGLVIIAGDSAVRASGLGVPVLTGSEGSAGVRSPAFAVPASNATRTSDREVVKS